MAIEFGGVLRIVESGLMIMAVPTGRAVFVLVIVTL
jgi:hypothetical protein